MSLLWVVQDNLFREDGHARLLAALKRLGCAYKLVSLRHFSDLVSPVDETDSIFADVKLPPGSKVFVMGSYKLARIARERGWTPGAFLTGLAYTEWSKHWPVLNEGAWVGALKDARVPAGTLDVFVRLVEDSKVFAGKVESVEEFNTWRDAVCAMATDNWVTGDIEVLVAPARKVLLEARTWVVNGRVVTASLYRRGGQVVYSDDVEDDVLAFAQSCADRWCPSDAFVLDVARTPEGLCVVEANCFNSAGFYAGDMQKLVGAVEERWE